MSPFFSRIFSWSVFIFTFLTTAFFSCFSYGANPSYNNGGPCVLDSVVLIEPSCNGICDGSVNLYVNLPLTLYYTWENLPGVETSGITGVCAGTYHFVITDSAACFIADSIVVTEPPPVPINIISQGTSCPGGCTGSLTVVPVDTLPYTYYWPGYMATGPVLSTLCQGTYNVIVTDVNGCSRIETADVGYIPPFQLSFFSSASSCLNSCDGLAAVVANGTPPFHYQWGTAPMQSSQVAYDLCVGSYYVNVTDSIGCTVTDSVYIDYLAPVDIVINASLPTCFGGCDGSASAVTTPAGNYSYLWSTSPPQFSSSATGLCSGTYTVTVTNQQTGCESYQTVVINSPLPPSLSFSVTPTYCNNSCSGAASVFMNVPPPITYLWSSGSVDQGDSLLCPGVYTVTVTDSAGCSTQGSVAVGAESLLSFTTNATCNSICDGTAGITLPFVSDWQIDWLTVPVQHTPVISNLCEGIYAVAIVDSSGCELNASVEVLASQSILSAASLNDVSCIGSCDGAISMIAFGNNPFQFEWNTFPVQTGPVISGLCSGPISVTITDSLGCTKTDSIFINEPEPETIYYFSVPNSCSQICDAVIEAVPASSSSLSFEWLTVPAQSGPIATGLCPGWIGIQITDSIGCITLDSVIIFDTPPLDVDLSVLEISCPFTCDGFVACQASGGNPGFTYQWSNGFQTPQIINVCAGTYSVTVTDVSGCTGISTVSLTDPLPLSVSYNITPALCLTCADGSIEALVSGGTPPFLYLWNPGGVGDSLLDSLVPGLYNLCIVDAHSCSICEDIFVTEYNGLQDDNDNSRNVSIYPNPFVGDALIKISDYPGKFNGQFIFDIYDINGKSINNIAIKFKGGSNNNLFFELSSTSVPEGIYFFRIEDQESNYFTGKLILESSDH